MTSRRYVRALRAGLLLPLALLASFLIVSCSDDGSPSPMGTANDGSGLPLSTVMARAVPGLQLTPRSDDAYDVAGSSGWLLQELRPRLPLGPEGEPGETAFFSISGPAQPATPAPSLGAGTYAVFFPVDEHSSVSPELFALSGDGSTLLPVAQMSPLAGGIFQQDTRYGDTMVSITPAFSTDIEPDNKAEMVLARQYERGDIIWSEYNVYQRTTDGRWQMLHLDYDDTPVEAVLDYWANVSAGVSIARRWDPETRLEKVWAWLSDENESVTPALLTSLDGGGDAATALNSLRAFFAQARVPFSPAFSESQPWPGFISAFRHTESVALQNVRAPDIRSQQEARVTSNIAFAEREGGTIVTRNFKTTFDLKRLDGRWLLQKVKAEQVGKAAVDTTPL